MEGELSYYSYIQKLPRLSQSDIEKLYESEDIHKDNLDDQIDELSNKLGINNLFDFSCDKNNISEEDLKKLESLRLKRFHKLINGKKSIYRTFPSKELISKVVEGNLYLALCYSKKYYKEAGSDYSFDDLFQMASEALISAAKYYIPSSIAKFSTYASRCIDNSLKRDIYNKDKKKTIKNDFFRKELSKFNLIETLLNSIDKDSMVFRDSSIRFINKAIRKYNKNMYYCFDKTIPLFKKGFSIKDVMNLYRSLISDSYINELVDGDDLDFIKHYVSLNELDYHKKTIKFEKEKIKLYMFKIHCIKELIEFEKRYKKENNGNVPSLEEQYEFLIKNQRILKRKNNSREMFENKRMHFTSFYSEYYDKYNIDLLSDDNNRKTEKENFEEIFKMYSSSIKELLQGGCPYVACYDCSGIDVFLTNKYDSDYLYLLYEDELNEEEIRKLYDDFIEKYGSLDDSTLFVKECIQNRVNPVSSYVKEQNKKELPNNIAALDFMNSMQFYKSKLSKKDFESINKARITLYSLDDSFETERFSRDKKLSVEEEVEVKDFFNTYYNVLSTLSDEEKQVISLCYDVNGYVLFNNKEIADKLNMSSNKVRGIKTRSLNKIRESELKYYLD